MKRRKKPPTIPIGTSGSGFFKRRIEILVSDAKTHFHILGTSGSGKSRLLASLYLSLLKNGLAATLIDPHGDLAKLVLAQLTSDGFFSTPDAFEKLIYLDLPTGEDKGLYVPFNVLKQPLPPHTVASNIKESMHRAWPALAGGSAPMFDTLVQDGCKVLITNQLPLTSLYRLLTDKAFRDQLLENEQDPDIVAFFHDQFDRLSLRDQADQAGSALRRAHLLTFSPILKYSLGQTENRLNFREIIDRDQSVIINLALTDSEARRLLGCLLTVSAEHGSLSRASLPYEERENSHHLFIDEFSEFSAQSEEALARMLSLTRKYGLFLVMAHQTWSQASERLRGALQNVGVEVAFRLGRSDAQHTAMIMGRVDPETVKHVVAQGEERSHPLFYSLPEQWERLTQELQDQPPRHFMFKTAQGKTIRGKTLDMKNPVVDPNLLKRIQDEYLSRYFVPQETVVAEKEKSQEPAEKVIFRRNKL